MNVSKSKLKCILKPNPAYSDIIKESIMKNLVINISPYPNCTEKGKYFAVDICRLRCEMKWLQFSDEGLLTEESPFSIYRIRQFVFFVIFFNDKFI